MNIQHKSRRPAFTMLELMVVIAIIAFLMSLTVGAMFSFIAGAREAATATTIAKVNKLLQERVDGLRQMDFTDAAQRFKDSTNNGSVELSEVIVRKFRMKRAFPQNLVEALGNDPQRYSSLAVLSSPPASFIPKYESGIVLYALLTSGETFGAASVGDDTFTASEVRNSPETAGLPCLVDAWGEPLRFYRWPTRLFKPGGAVGVGTTTLPLARTFATPLVLTAGKIYGADGLPGANGVGGQGAYGSDDIPNCGSDGAPGIVGTDDDGNGTIDDITELGWPGSDDYEPLNYDADDPYMLLISALTTSNAVLQFEQGSTTGTPNLLLALHTPFTYAPMLVVSAGSDRQLGLLEPSDFSTDCGYLACPTITLNGPALTLQFLTDNITNLNQSSSGK